MAEDALTDWRPTASIEVLKHRARMLAGVREFFSRRDVLEVETPVLSSAGTPDPALASLSTRYTGPLFPGGRTLYLQTSPEFPMKRLLAAGSGSIYQICKVFRDGESGRLHNPEFTMVEWYRIGFDHHRLMTETAELVTELLGPSAPARPTEFVTFRDAFRAHIGIDPLRASVADCAAAARADGLDIPLGLRAESHLDMWLDFLLIHLVEPKLDRERLTFLYDYPASQAALARLAPGDPRVASRFELYLAGMELANGFHELANADDQHARLKQYLQDRVVRDLPEVPLDEHLQSAMASGLPDCAGVALGFDRLVMAATGARSLREVLAFPFDRA